MRFRRVVVLAATFALFATTLWMTTTSARAVGSPSGGGWHAQNAGSSGSQAALNDVTFVDADHGWAVGESIPAPGASVPLVLSTSDGGATWHSQDARGAGRSGHLGSVSFVDSKHGWALGTSFGASGGSTSVIIATTDGGVTWSAQNAGIAGTDARLSSITFADAQHGWAVGSVYDDSAGTLSPLILATTDAGATWYAQNAGNAGNGGAQLASISFIDVRRGWAVGQSSSQSGAQSAVILATTDGGATWRAQNAGSAGSSAGLSDVAFSDAAHGWAVGSSYDSSQSGGFSFLILATSDGGATWNSQEADGAGQFPGRFSSLGSVSFVDAKHGWAVGRSEDAPSDFAAGTLVILATTDGGATWNAQDANSGGRRGFLSSVSFVDANHGWVAGGDFNPTTDAHSAVILATSDGGMPTPDPLVVLIGGLGSEIPASGGDWTFVKQRLEKAGFKGRVFVAETHPGLPPGDTSDVIDSKSPDWRDSAARLDHQLSAAGYKNRDLVLVGHSMGGLIARVYAANWQIPGSGCRPLGIVQLGTPNKGSKAANLAIGPLKSEAADRLADDASMAAFNAEFPNAEALPIYRIAGSYFPKSAGAYVAKQALTPKKQNLLAAVLSTIVGVYGTAYNDSVVTVDSVRGGPRAGWQGCTVFKAVHNNAKWLLSFRDDCGCVLPRRFGKKGAAAIDELIMTQIIKDVRGVERSAAVALPSWLEAPVITRSAGAAQ